MNHLKKPMWEGHNSRVLVAAHRGARFIYPENTMPAFRYAIEQGVDMIETDVRMTRDHQLVLMHDAAVDRTTDGKGAVCDMTLAEFKALNAAADYDDYPEGVSPPTLEEFLTLCSRHDGLLIDFELKEYPTPGREEWAYECCDRTIEMLEAYGFGDRCVLNSFSARLLEYIVKKYGDRYRLHGYYPYAVLRDSDHEDPSWYKQYFYCLCISSVAFGPDGPHRYNFNVPKKAYFDAVLAEGIEPWVCAGIYSEPEIIRCAELGASLITTDYPATILEALRRHGYHD